MAEVWMISNNIEDGGSYMTLSPSTFFTHLDTRAKSIILELIFIKNTDIRL